MIKGLETINLIILPLLLVVYVLPVAVSHLETQDQGPMPVPYYPPQSYSSASTNMPAIKDDVKVPPINILQSSGDPRPGMMETSEYMIGKVGVLIIFVESTGRIDPNMEDWQDWRMVQVEQGIYRALWWWASQYPFAPQNWNSMLTETGLSGILTMSP